VDYDAVNMRASRAPWLLAQPTLALVFCAGLASAQTGPSDPIIFHAQEAAKAAAARNWPIAEEHYRAVLKLDPNMAEAHSNLALACYFQQKIGESEREFREAVRLQPNLFLPNFFLGQYYFDRNDLQKSIPFLNAAVKLQPKEPQSRRLLAAALVGSGSHEAAIRELKQNLALDANDIESLYSLAKIYMYLAQQAAERVNAHPAAGRFYHNLILARRFQLEGKWSTARKYYLAARDAKGAPTEVAISIELGDIALATGELAAAIRHYGDDLGRDSRSFRAHFGLGQAYLVLGNLSQSLEHFEAAIRIRPEFFRTPPVMVAKITPELAQQRVNQLQSAGRETNIAAELALVILKSAIGTLDSSSPLIGNIDRNCRAVEAGFPKPRFPADAVTLKRLADEWFEAKRYEVAAEAYQRLTLMSPKNTGTLRQLAEALFASGDSERAATALTNLLRMLPGDAGAEYFLQRCFEDMASATLSQMAKTSPDSYRVHQLTAELFLAQDRAEDAINEYELALESRPGDKTLHFGLGQAQLRKRNMEAAITEFQKVIERDPNNAEAHFNVARCYMSLQQPERAGSFARTAIRLKPDLLAGHAILGRILMDRGETHAALSELEKALPTDRDGTLHYQVFLAYRKLNEPAKAEKAFVICKQLRERHAEQVREEIEAGTRSASDPQ
jgi:tetratricopeptide (TPR) repeat protein